MQIWFHIVSHWTFKEFLDCTWQSFKAGFQPPTCMQQPLTNTKGKKSWWFDMWRAALSIIYCLNFIDFLPFRNEFLCSKRCWLLLHCTCHMTSFCSPLSNAAISPFWTVITSPLTHRSAYNFQPQFIWTPVQNLF
jgi:hypothetical protein